MQIVSRPTLDRVALKLPVNAKDLLRVGSLNIYDLLQLIVNSLNKVVRTNDSNIDKEEDFLAALSDALNEWADEQEENYESVKNSILAYISGGTWDASGFITGSGMFSQSFWGDIANCLLSGVELFAPGQEGNEYDRDGEIEAGTEWALRMDMRSDGHKWCSLQPLVDALQSNGSGVNIIDLADRAVEGGRLTNIELRENVFIYEGLPIAGAAHVVAEDGSVAERYVLFKVITTDLFDSHYAIYLQFRSASFDIPDNVGYYYNFVQIIEDGSDDYGWAMSVFGDVMIDTDSNTLRLGDFIYQLTPSSGSSAKTYEYLTPTITGFSYDTMSSSGGTVYPTITVEQQVIKSGQSGYIPITANYHYDSESGKMVTEYTNGDYMQSDGGLALEFTYETLPSNVVVSTANGSVKKMSSSTSVFPTSVATISVKATMNGKAAATASTAEVKQAAATISLKQLNLASSATSSYIDISKSAGVSVTKDTIASTADWFTITSAEVKGTYVRIYYSVASNTGAESRTASVTASTILGEKTLLEITQTAQAYSISSATDNIDATATATSRTVTLTKTAGLNVSLDEIYTGDSWITITDVVVNDTSVVLSYTAEANPNTVARTGTIQVPTNVSSKWGEISVVQAAKAVITASVSTLAISTTVGTPKSATLTVNAINLVGPISVSTGSSSVFTASPASISISEGTSGKVVTITFSPSVVGTASGTLTLSAKNAANVTVSLSGTAEGQGEEYVAYYGASSTLPATNTDVEAYTPASLTGTDVLPAITGAKHLWVAVPTAANVDSVVCKDSDNTQIVLSQYTVGDYTIYDWSMAFVNTDSATFTVTL